MEKLTSLLNTLFISRVESYQILVSLRNMELKNITLDKVKQYDFSNYKVLKIDENYVELWNGYARVCIFD